MNEERPGRQLGWQSARQLCQDMQDLKAMSESDLRRYCGHPGGSTHNRESEVVNHA